MNNNGFKKYLPYIGLVLLAAGAWFTVRSQAAQALPRVEAYQTFVTTEDLDKMDARFTKEFDRINNKLDRILEGR